MNVGRFRPVYLDGWIMGEIGWIVGEFFWVFFEILKYFSKKHQQIPCRYGRCAWFLCLRVSLAWRVAFFLVFWSCMRFLWQNCGEVVCAFCGKIAVKSVWIQLFASLACSFLVLEQRLFRVMSKQASVSAHDFWRGGAVFSPRAVHPSLIKHQSTH